MTNAYIFNGYDMRIYDNLALLTAASNANVRLFYIADQHHKLRSSHAQKFINDAITEINTATNKRCTTVSSIADVINTNPSAIFMNKMIYPKTIQNPNWHPYTTACKRANIPLTIVPNNYLLFAEPLRTEPYVKFTPFYNKAIERWNGHSKPKSKPSSIETTAAFTMRNKAFGLLTSNYDHDVGSGVSPYLARGIISIREAVRSGKNDKELLRQILWREFYYQIATHAPDLLHITTYSTKQLTKKQQENLAAWKSHTTTYDYINIALRSLRKTGFINNRMRMLVAELLTSNNYYNVPWWYGEDIFEAYLNDYDFVLNRCNWQWIADSTKPWSRPSFRYFNLDRQRDHPAVMQ
jgi:deoxyribodipyrimidine photolyase